MAAAASSSVFAHQIKLAVLEQLEYVSSTLAAKTLRVAEWMFKATNDVPALLHSHPSTATRAGAPPWFSASMTKSNVAPVWCASSPSILQSSDW